MTEAAFKNKNNTNLASGERISTHPAYKEYSWDSIASRSRPAGAADPRQTRGNVKNTTAATLGRQPVNTGRASQNTASKRSNVKKAPNAAPKMQGATVKSSASAALKPKIKKTEKVRRKAITTIHTIAVEKKYTFPMSIVLIALCFTILIMAIVTTSVQISEITAENSALLREYNSLVSDENELRLLLETRDDLRVVERIATEELGMVKKDQVDRYYLTVHKEDRIEIIEEIEADDSSLFDGIMSFGGSIVERIRGFLKLD